MWAVSRPGRAPPPPLFLLAVALLAGPAGAYKLNVPKVLLPFSRDKRVPFVLGAEGGCYSWSPVCGEYAEQECLIEPRFPTLETFDEVELPLEHYELELQDEVKAPNGFLFLPVAQLDTSTATVTALQLGQVNLAFVHKNIHMRGSLGLPNCTIYVVEPGFLGFTVQPGNRWVLEVKRAYTITVEVFDKSSTKVYPSDNLRITHQFPQEYFEELTSSTNGSYHIVRVLKEGVTVIKAMLLSVLLQWTWDFKKQQQQGMGGLEQGQTWILKYSEAEYSPPDYIVQMEKEEKQGDRILVSGIKTGAAVIKVRIEEPVYKVVPVLPGSLALEVYDLCLAFLGPATAYLRVSNMYELEVDLIDKVEIGKSVLVSVRVLGSHRSAFRSKYFAYMHLQLKAASPISGLEDYFVSPISHEQEMKIYLPITLTPSFLTFPYHSLDLLYRYKVQVEGGSGNFTWTSSNQSVATVTVKGVVAAGLTEGQSAVQARDVQNPFHFGEIQVSVLKLSKMELLPFHADAEIGQNLEVPLAMYHVEKKTGAATAFTDCSLLALDVTADKQGVFALSEEGKQKAGATFCSTIQLTAKSLGHTLVTASATVFEEYFETSATFAAYEPLKAVNPVQLALVTWHSMKEMVFEGGPGPWVLEPSRFFLELKTDDEKKFQVAEVRLPARRKQNQYIYRVTCLELGEQVFTFQVGNHPGVLNPSPAVEMVQLNFICAHPASMAVTPVYKLAAGAPPCPLPQHHKQLVPVSSLRNTILELALFDQHRRKFDNFSSLILEWTSANESLARFTHPRSMQMVDKDDGTGQTRLHGHQLLEVHQIKGTVLIAVNFVKYSERGSPKEVSNSPASAAVELLLVEDVTVIPDNVTMYNHPNVKHSERDRPGPSPSQKGRPMEELGDYSEVYMLRAVAVGQTTLVATAWDKTGVKFMSSPRKVEIFPPFRLLPEKMTLIPHNMWQVMSEGGPQPQSLIHFSISNRTVAEVNGLGQVTAKAVGTAFILGTIRAVSEDTGKVIVFSQDQVEMEVVQLRMIRIHAPATRLVTGTQMPVYVVGLTSTLTPFSFGNSRPPLTFHWAVSKRDILDLLPRHSEISLALPPESNFAMGVRTRAAGRTSIRVAVRTSDAEAGQFEGNATELLDEVQILVFDNLQLFSPECPAEQILMSMNSQLRLLTNRDGAAFVSTQILQCFPNSSVIEEDRHGLLKAGAVTGTAVLEVTSLELFGVNQTVITGVRVAPVSYLQFSSTPKLYTAARTPLLAFPLGMALTLTVRFFDSAGVRFHTQNNQLQLALNRDDLLLIRPSNQNYTYTAQAVNRGVTLVGVWDERHPGMADYISVPVEHAIGPDLSAPLAVGDVVCFSTPLVNQEGEPGTWQVSPGGLLEMDVARGAAFAKRPGKATVFHEIPGIVKTYREVVVHGPSRLSLQLGPKHFLTNAANASEFRVFITTSGPATLQGPCSSEQIRAINDLLSPESQLICQLDFNPKILDIPASKIFHIRPAFYPEKGLYACLVTVKDHPDEDLLALSTAEGSVDISAALRSEEPQETQRVALPFLPAFFLNQSEIVLSSSQVTSEILVLGARRVTDTIEAHPTSPVVQVDPPLFLPDMPGLVLFPVRVVNLTSLHRRAAPVFVNLSCGLTGQRAAVLVRPEQEHHLGFDLCAEASLVRQLVGSYQVLLFTVFAVLASTMVIFLIYNAFLNRVQTVPLVYIPSASTQDGYLYPPLTAQHHPSSLRNRTQAWLWSVRR
ncbi:PREDICTED: nuclear pore membrane glycoprotein 210-like [Thamnophis sirtalis]|uniref:Nuclear pore membrane glycoprotein 210-like n=1 Tax=Thamnophis sirtalis TaxID=35019 RepID=A0A6I9Y9X8_9SAUR|nr:PREDICTED: nuclear pore membrane glycoprotein 210-like [Thamnophis sirtalis]